MCADACQQILGNKDFYAKLGVPKEASQEEIKKAYRKLSMQVHPDRCHEENATKAFQELAHAYQTLSDPEKRRIYDQYGDVSERRRPPQDPRQHQGYYYEGEMTPEDLFNMFFGIPPRGYQRQYMDPRQHQQRRNNQAQENPSFLSMFFRILPLLFLGLFQFLPHIIQFVSRPSVKGAVFLEKPSFDTIAGTSNKYHFTYYVSRDWIQSYGRSYNVQERLSNEADRLYLEDLQIKCELEKNQNSGKEGKKCRAYKRVAN